MGIRIDLVEAAVAEQDNDYSREAKVAGLAEHSAVGAGLFYQAGHAALSQAWALDNLNRFVEAETNAAKARTLLSRIGDEAGIGHASKLLGDVYIDQGRYELARSEYQRSVLTFHKLGSQAGESVSLNNLGYVLIDLGDLQGARNLFEHSLSISRASGDLKL